MQEIHPVLPVLIESIFGFGSQSGWGLGRITRSHYAEFRALRELLNADGPLLRLLNRLAPDPHFRYEFPVSCLPVSAKSIVKYSGGG